MFGIPPVPASQSDQYPNSHVRASSVWPARALGKSLRWHDGFTILLVWAGYACLTLLVVPNHSQASTYELLYYAVYNVLAGAFVGFYLFDRLPKDGLALFAAGASFAILCGTFVNELIVGPLAFGTEPINGVSAYYGLTDSVSVVALFLLIRLAAALRSLRQRVHSRPGTPSAKQVARNAHYFFVRVADGTRRIYAQDVVYMEAERDFTHIVCVNGKHFVSENLKSLLNTSAEFGLVRVHKSFAVNLARVERLTRTQVDLGEWRLPVGRRYYPEVAETWTNPPA